MPHPTTFEFALRKQKLTKVIDDICFIMDSQLVITRTDKGVADVDINYQLADEMQTFGKELKDLGERCNKKGLELRQQMDNYKVELMDNDKIHFLEEIQQPEVKSAIRALKNPLPVKKHESEKKVVWQVKAETPPLEYITDSEDEILEEQIDAANKSQRKPTTYSGNPDTRFRQPKTNSNDPEKHTYLCDACKKIFRSLTELRYHVSHHEEEFFSCLKCHRSFRSYTSFKAHCKTHSAANRHTCKKCGDSFERLSSLQNHEQKHSTESYQCKECGYKNKYRQQYLDHIQHAHLPEKTIQCPICKKFYQTRGSMASHKRKKHGPVRKLVKGYSLVPSA